MDKHRGENDAAIFDESEDHDGESEENDGVLIFSGEDDVAEEVGDDEAEEVGDEEARAEDGENHSEEGEGEDL